MFKKIVKEWNAHGAACCTVLSVGFTVIEGVWAYRAGKRAGQHPEWTTEEKIMNVVGPAATGAGAIVFAVCAQKTNMAHIATLAAENVMNEKKRQKFIKKAEEVVGKENIDKIKQSMHPEPKKEEIPIGTNEYLFIDDTTGAKTVDTIENMYENINRFQMKLHTQPYVTLGDWLEIGGFEHFKKGSLPITEDCELSSLEDKGDDDLGWCVDKLWEYLDRGWMSIYLVPCTREDGSTYYIIDFEVPPTVSVFYQD